MTLGLFLLSRLPVGASMVRIEATLLLLGLGMGLVMQVLVIAVQNAVDYRDLGVATSGNTLFRSVGGSVGTAVLGAVFAAQLAGEARATTVCGRRCVHAWRGRDEPAGDRADAGRRARHMRGVHQRDRHRVPRRGA